jgi:CheY-like chemotaxis protein
MPVVLLVEDSPADREIFQRAFRNEGTLCDLRCVYDGESALDYLFRREKYADPELSPRPDLVLLDLNLPNLSGRELLHLIRSYPELRHIPVVVLTTTHSPADVLDSYRLGANSFLTKPTSFSDVVETIRRTCRFWFDTATLPPNS